LRRFDRLIGLGDSAQAASQSAPSQPLTVMEKMADTIVTGGPLYSPLTLTAGGETSLWVGHGDRPELRPLLSSILSSTLPCHSPGAQLDPTPRGGQQK
jgi:hypothetical protein